MPRPRKWRKVCCLPESNLYGPLNGSHIENEIIIMTVEEYETIRLIDLEGLTQEECSEKMQVARATVQNIYKDARSKIAESLVNGNILKIEGGDYKLYSENERVNSCGRCRRNRCGRNFIESEQYDNEEDT
ncbi:DUF134 domain-containing protein [Alkalibaculum sp. M08DMB]|uniref:UPF0251 protein GC105_07515 n=1 Tax=Alkalibaculum sporogenes TaxID=2655001 RepID=A0A6A7K8D2_9FIRM|nr:DUF134 domain-containing protein [Alkalibaculum sporogenes]MPW25635.1 DUF134 domain-containing protein [Alkalibaculum sporogenes]